MSSHCGFPFQDYPVITMAHGGGGRLTQLLIDQIFKPVFKLEDNEELHDAASVFPTHPEDIKFTTDSYVVQPLFFTGGDIGHLAVCGTCNDLTVSGARPEYLSCSLILEEGLSTQTLYQIVKSMRNSADQIGVRIVTGDTKVIEKSRGDGLYINTTGIGSRIHELNISPSSIGSGNAILVTGDIGRHGATIMASRNEFGIESHLSSDCAHLYPLLKTLTQSQIPIHCMRDLTRGGLATALCELSEQSQLKFTVFEQNIPIKENVANLCKLLGLDPLYVACEGRMVIILPEAHAEQALSILRKTHHTEAQIIGTVQKETQHGLLTLKTNYGSERVLRRLSGEQLPRIC